MKCYKVAESISYCNFKVFFVYHTRNPDITDILLKVALDSITLTPIQDVRSYDCVVKKCQLNNKYSEY